MSSNSKYLHNEEEAAKALYPRYKILYLALFVATLLIMGRLWYLQIIKGSELYNFSQLNLVKESKIIAPRGLILDREGRVLVDNLLGFQATISPQYATKLEETAVAIGEVLQTPASEIITAVKRSRIRNGPFFPVILKDNLTLDEVHRLKLLRLYHPGLNINQSIVRYYPLQDNGAQLFGYVGEISKEQIERYNVKYRGQFNFEQGDIIGKSGLEEVWETFVRGEDGISFIQVDARGRQTAAETPGFLGVEQQEEVPGNNLVLTIDKDIQEAAYKAMRKEDKIGNRLGGLVAMKANGEILAWVNEPSFDPNKFATRISSELWSQLINDPFKPLRNKIVQDHHPPGSTFKPIVGLAALQEKVITPNTIIYAPGAFRFGRRTYHDSLRGGHGNITILEAVERSSNVFFYKMGISLGIDKMAQYARLLGVGEKTNIRLSNEKSGLMPTSDWKLKTFGEEWQPGENLSNAIGQGFVLTSVLQMAVAYMTIGLEGLMPKPFVVKKIIGQDNQVIKSFDPEVVRDASQPNEQGVYIEKRHFKTVKKSMWKVANGPRGTARWWKIPGVEMAGKTGTVQMRSYSAEQIYEKCELKPLNQRHHGWYVAYAPSDKPEIVVSIFAQHSCHGNTGGAPVVRDVIRAYFEKYKPEMIKEKKKKKRVVNKKPEPIPTDDEILSEANESDGDDFTEN